MELLYCEFRISDFEFKNTKGATKIRISQFEFRNLNSMPFALCSMPHAKLHIGHLTSHIHSLQNFALR